MGFISHHEVKRGLISDGMRAVIMRKLGMGNRFRPGHRVIATEDPKVSLDFLVYSFGFSVRLRVVGSGEG